MASGGQDQQRESHLISLKVMRLSRPSLVTEHNLYFGSPNVTPSPSTEKSSSIGERPNTTSILTEALSDLSLSQLERVHPPSSGSAIHPIIPSEAEHQEAKAGASTGTLDIGDFGMSELLSMPASFGNIYLGETFTSYICANNESAHPVRDVILKAELQTSTLRFALSDTLASQRRSPSDSFLAQSPPTSGGHIQLLESGKTNEMIVSHEIKELGIHILVCSIQYTTLDGQQKSFRKFYKFQVLNPLSVKTKVNQSTPGSMVPPQDPNGQQAGATALQVSNGGRVLLEAMIQNVSGVTMWMERMRFEAADAFTVQDLNVVIDQPKSVDHSDTKALVDGPTGTSEETTSIFGEHDYFAPNDVRQYLYVLTPKPGKELFAKTTNVLGKMDILWRSQFGETGRLQTSQLTRKPAPLDEIAVQVVKIPERIRLEEIFSIEIVVKNQSLSGVGASHQQQQQQQQQVHHHQQQPNHPGTPLRHGSAPQFPLSPSSAGIGGSLARPPAAVSRGGYIPPARPIDSPTSNQSPQMQQQQQSPPNIPSDQNAMKLMLTGVKQKMGAILLSGPNSRQLGPVPAGGEVRVRLDWFPLTSGVQKIGGIRLVDIISGYSVELDHLTHVFVEHT
ncbi:hypothetical protein FBU30_009811 [Linnemannia zychae]|nr:hypothetical protein FBU30_009811 [Linnemannia zychae]